MIKSNVRRAIIRGAIAVSGRGASGRKILYDEFAKLSSNPGQILHRDGKHLLVQGGDHVIWCGADDSLIAEGLIKHGHWQRNDFDTVIQFLASREKLSHGAFVNVGANIGTQVIYAILCGRFLRAVAYEPEPNNFAMLTRNIKTNGFQAEAMLLQAAVSDTAGTLNLELNRERPGMHHVVQQATAATVAVPSVRLADGLAAEGVTVSDVSLIWIDVEGHEYEVFRGMSEFVKARVPEYSCGSTSAENREAWRAELQDNYATIAVVDQGMLRETSFADAFDEHFTNILVC